jgi:hypothetical protein
MLPDGFLLTGAYQERVDRWVRECFGDIIRCDMLERSDRFIEESLELAQTVEGFTAERAHALVDYVFNRPMGARRQEVGGVMTTLAALCNASCPPIIMGLAANDELDRIEQPEVVLKIRKKQQAKKDIHGPLP